MAITVKQLVDTPHLRTRFHSGRAGGEQVINWAHSCEMPDPWHWLERFDMLMTNGLGLPAGPENQARYVSRLADAGISAIAIGEDVGAPPISSAMTRASERRALPILLTAFEVPFAALARVVGESKTDFEERRRLLKTSRIYESLRTATIEGRDGIALFEDLGVELGCRLDVVDLTAWSYAFDPRRPLASSIRCILLDTLRRCAGRLPAILRLDVDGRAALAVPIPSRRAAALLAGCFTESVPELSVLQHASTVAALELEKLASQRDALSRAGAELFDDLLSQRLDPPHAVARLRTVQLAPGEVLVVAWRQSDTALHQELFARGLPHLLRVGDGDAAHLALIRDDPAPLSVLVDILPDGCPVGCSAPVGQPERIPNAAREARWALHGAPPGTGGVTRYGEDGASSSAFALERAEELAEHVLGPLVRYDRTHQTELVRTLSVLLENNRSATRTAAELFIHRQTLVYRIRRIEELTARSLSSTKDVVDLWLGLRAIEAVEGSTAPGV